MRGKDCKKGGSPEKSGITPACAGKSPLPGSVALPVRDHPRVCGEKFTGFHYHARHMGSPPRVRGKVTFQLLCRSMIRITPACAGKSTRLSLFAIFSGDHPRVCGEKIACGHYMLCYSGSPPRVRGKADPKKHRQRQTGITPACAGKRECPTEGAPAAGDHPRVCGEKKDMRAAGINPIGSPPRVRGKGPLEGLKYDAERITPACAGKSVGVLICVEPIWDHPRVCGEKHDYFTSCLPSPGSPPRVRGKAQRHLRFLLPTGITPACAGKRGRHRQQTGRLWDHPRVCGEKTKKIP